MLLRLGRTLAYLSLVAGCAEPAVPPVVDARPDGTDAPPGPIGLLSLETEDELALFFGELADIRVLYTQADGTTPIARATLRFGFEGMANDSTLAETEAVTSEDGRAMATVVAGHTEASYRVRISVPEGPVLFVDTSVQDLGLGAIRVSAAYEGSRPVQERTVRLLDSGSCDDADVETRAGIRSSVLHVGVDETQFFALEPGAEYVVLVASAGSAGATLAVGCEDGVVVEEATESNVNLLFVDRPLDFEDAQYEMLLEVDASNASATVREVIAQAGLHSVEEVGTDAELVLARILSSVEDAGGAAFSVNGLAPGLESALSESGRGPTLAIEHFADLLSGQVRGLALEARLDTTDVLRMNAQWQTMRVHANAEGGSSVEFDFSPSVLGSPMSDVELRGVEGADEAWVPSLNLWLRLGSLSELVWEALATEAGYTDATALLTSEAGCETVIAWARAVSDIRETCNDACVMKACVSAMELIEVSIRAALESLDESRALLHLEGIVSLADAGSDLAVDSMVADGLMGRWGSIEDADVVHATLTGDRTVDEPM